MKRNVVWLTRFLICLVCFPLLVGLIVGLIWDYETGKTVGIIIVGLMCDWLIFRKWFRR